MSRTGLFQTTRRLLIGASIAALSATAATAQPAAIDDARLQAAATGDDADWLMFGQDYTNQRFSSLTQINRDNVRSLSPAWVYQLSTIASTQTHPVVADGVIYFSTPENDVVAANAATGAPIWRYRHTFSTERGLGSNRGVALGYGMVYIATDDRRLIALNQATGEKVFDVEVARWDVPAEVGFEGLAMPTGGGFAFRYPPLVYDGKVYIGSTLNSGSTGNFQTFLQNLPAGTDATQAWIQGNLGNRGFLAAFDAMTGAEEWRFYMTPEEGWEGTYGTTTPEGETFERDVAGEQGAAERYPNAWAAGGVASHFAPAVDVATNTLYIGTGGPGTPIDLARPGDNLYANSIVALDADTGDLRWYFQVMPHPIGNDADDLISQAMLFEQPNGSWAVGDGSKNGRYYAVDATTGGFLFSSDDIATRENFLSWPTPEGLRKAPGQAGGVSISPTSYDPNTGIAYIATIDRPGTYTLVSVDQGASLPPLRYQNYAAVPVGQADGRLSAIDLHNGGEMVWQVVTPQPLVGGALATAGGLVFMGEANGNFRAYNSANGDVLWSFQTGAFVGASAISYSVDGRQYVVVPTGAAAPAAGSPIGPDANRPGGAVFAFALPQ